MGSDHECFKIALFIWILLVTCRHQMTTRIRLFPLTKLYQSSHKAQMVSVSYNNVFTDMTLSFKPIKPCIKGMTYTGCIQHNLLHAGVNCEGA